jgi:oligopeptide transport system permease protein
VRAFILRRLLGIIPTMLVIVTVSFFMIRLAPGNPFAAEKAIAPEVRRGLEERYGFDKPIAVQFGRYLENIVFHFDLGLSTKYPSRSVNEIIKEAFPVTATIGVVALIWALMVGITAGITGALRQNTIWDYSAMSFAMIGISMPTFVLGPLLALIFALTLFWLPPAGWGTWRHVLLPGIALGTAYAAVVARLTRAGLLEIVRQDFVRTAHAKGLPERLVLWRHVLKGGLLPLVSYLGPMIAALFTGSVVVEAIFATPGLGPYFVDSAHNRDYFLTMGLVIFYSTFLLLANLALDVAYGFLDPRIRYE